MTVYQRIAEFNKVITVDIGGFTLDYLLIRGGRPDLGVCDSLEKGVIKLYNDVASRINSEKDILLDDTDIDRIIRGERTDYDGEVLRIVGDMTRTFVDDILGTLRERGLDLKTSCMVFIGGGGPALPDTEERQVTAMGKKNAFVTTIGFNKNDPAHVQVAEFLNSMERGKAQYIVNAVLAYQNGAQAGDMPHAGQAVDYERIRQFVLQVIREHERQEALHTHMAEEPARPDAAEEREGASFGFDEDALSGIMSSLEAFKR